MQVMNAAYMTVQSFKTFSILKRTPEIQLRVSHGM